jgi:hypothetical protein
MRLLSLLASEPRRVAVAIDEWFFAPADDRAYAALRIGYAVAAFAVLVDFWQFRYTLLASTGLFGGATAGGGPLLPLNVLTLARSEMAVSGVMVVAGAAIVCLGLGVFPRTAAIATYVWTLSYAATAPVSQSGFDTILRVVGFVLVICPSFGPWRLGSSRHLRQPPVYGLRLVQWQLMLIYVCTVWLKAPDQFWRNGEATTYFMLSMFARFPDPSLASIGPLGALLDYGTLLVETTVPFLLWMRRTRFLGVFLGVGLHVGIGVTSKLALFTVCILPLYFAFFERQDFDRIATWFGRGTERREPG